LIHLIAKDLGLPFAAASLIATFPWQPINTKKKLSSQFSSTPKEKIRNFVAEHYPAISWILFWDRIRI
jgi:hypothetical protein